MRIKPCRSINRVYFDNNGMTCEGGSGLFDSMLKDASGILRSRAYRNGSGIDLCHFNSFPNELIQTLRFFIYEQNEIAACGFINALILYQRGSGSADACERSAEFVSERVDERRAE